MRRESKGKRWRLHGASGGEMGKMSFFRHRRLFVRRKRADANGPRNEEIKTGEGKRQTEAEEIFTDFGFREGCVQSGYNAVRKPVLES